MLRHSVRLLDAAMHLNVLMTPRAFSASAPRPEAQADSLNSLQPVLPQLFSPTLQTKSNRWTRNSRPEGGGWVD
jgi:hypothetical protein